MEQQRDFVQNGFLALIKNADSSAAPNWGKMSFQHMIEHLVIAVKNVNGNIKVEKVYTPADKIPAFQQFLTTDKEFRENTKSPALPEELLPLHFKTTQEAIDTLEKEIGDLFKVYNNNPGIRITDPVFGDLDYDLAVRLLYKHFLHHAKQFGLIVGS